MHFRATNFLNVVNAWQDRYHASTTGVSAVRLVKAVKNSKYLTDTIPISTHTWVYVLSFPDKSIALFINRDFNLPFVIHFTPSFAGHYHEWLYGYRMATAYYDYYILPNLQKQEAELCAR